MTRASAVEGTEMKWQGSASGSEASGDWPQTRGEFEAFVERYQDPLVRYAFRRLGCLQDAEDAAQEVFVKAYAMAMEGQRPKRPAAYLYRMTANACTDVLRRRKRAARLADQLGPGRVASEGSVADEASRIEELQRIERWVSQLPRRQAEAIRLRVWDGLRFEEIADVIGCPITTAKSRFRYGLLKLQQIITRRREDRS